MKRLNLLIVLFLLVSVGTLFAEDYYTIFKVGGNICTPVTLKTSRGTYTLYNVLKIKESFTWFEAFDCNGNKIMNPGSSHSYGTNEPTIRTYVFTTLYPTAKQSDSQENDQTDNYRNSYTQRGQDSQNEKSVGALAGEALGLVLSDLTADKRWSAETNQVNLSTGYGPTYGGIGLKMYYDSPAIIGIGGGIGLNPKYSENSFDNQKIHWSGFIRLQFSKFVNMEVFAASHYFKDLDNTEVGLGAYLNYQHTIYKRLGISGGAGFILGNLSEDKVKGEFSWNIGLTFNLYED